MLDQTGFDAESVFEALVDASGRLQTLAYIEVATLVIFLYQGLLNLGREINVIWTAPWSFPKCLYSLVRVFGLAMFILPAAINTQRGHSVKTCRDYFGFYIIASGTISETLINTVLGLRLYALFGRNRKCLYGLMVLLMVELSLGIFGTYHVAKLFQQNLVQFPENFPILGCYPINISEKKYKFYTLYGWIPALAVAVTFFLLMINRLFLGNALNRQPWSRLFFNKEFHSPIYHIFFRDGAIYFWMFSVSLFVSILIQFTTENEIVLLVFQNILFLCQYFSGSELVLHLREVSMNSRDNSNTLWSATMSYQEDLQAKFELKAYPMSDRIRP